MIQQADSKPGEQRLEELRKTRIDSVEHKALEKQPFLEQRKGADLILIYIYIFFFLKLYYVLDLFLLQVSIAILPLHVFDVHFPLSTETP